MTALAASNVTFVRDSIPPDVGVRNRRIVKGTIQFGDGALTYPSKGVPLPVPVSGVGGMGLARKLTRLFIMDESNADAAQGMTKPLIVWDNKTQTIRLFHAGSGAVDATEFATSEAPASLTIGVVLEGI